MRGSGSALSIASLADLGGAALLAGVDGSILDVNSEALSLYGYTRTEMLTMSIRDLRAEREREAIEGVLEETAKHGLELHVDHVRADGTPLPVAVRSIPVDVNGERVMLELVRDLTETLRTQAALRASEERFSAVFRGSGVGMALTHLPDARIADVNDAFCSLLELTREEIIGHTSAELGIWLDPSQKQESLSAVDNTGRSLVRDAAVQTRTGQARRLLMSIEKVSIGGEDYVVSGIQDMTERQRMEERYALMFESMAEGLALHEIILDENGTPCDYRFIDVNPAFVEMTGMKAADVIGRTVLEVLPGIEPSWIERYGAVAQTGVTVRFEQYTSALDRHYGVVAYSPQVAQFITLVSDITERKRAEDALRESEEKHRALFETMSEGIVYEDSDGMITSANPAAERLLGLSLDQMQGRTSTDPRWRAVHEDGSPFPGEAHSLRVAAKTGKPATGEVMGIYNPESGEYVWLSVNSVPEFHPGEKEPFRAYAVFRDISERKAADEALRQLNETLEARVAERTAELERASRDLETFSYSVSHDLRAPLRAMSGFAELLTRRHRDDLDELGRHYVDTIAASGEHLGILIEELLEYARLGRQLVRAEPVPLETLVTQLRVAFADRLAEVGGALDVTEPLAVPLADPTLVERILTNLVENAIKYQRPGVGPVVILSATRRDGRVLLAVADNGIGIAPQHHDRIFEPFTRLHAEDAYEGTGIGLAIVRKAARLMGSDVTLVSIVGEGSTFGLELPAAPVESPGPRRYEPHKEGTET
jgi:PAS domain S-box-containing protein